MVRKILLSAGSTLLTAALVSGGLIPSASADTEAVIDGAIAGGLCGTSYPGTTGPDQLSSCQWDMQVIRANLAYPGGATGAG